MRAIRVNQWGGPEVLELLEDAPMPEPSGHEQLVRVTRAGINYADTHAAENSYLARYELPMTPGAEVAGITEDGQRVVALTTGGGYAQYAAVRWRPPSRSPTASPTSRRWRCSSRG